MNASLDKSIKKIVKKRNLYMNKKLIVISIIIAIKILILTSIIGMKKVSIKKADAEKLKIKNNSYQQLANMNCEDELDKFKKSLFELEKEYFINCDRIDILEKLNEVIEATGCAKLDIRFNDNTHYDSFDEDKKELYLKEDLTVSIIGDRYNIIELIRELNYQNKRYDILSLSIKEKEESYLAEIMLTVKNIKSNKLNIKDLVKGNKKTMNNNKINNDEDFKDYGNKNEKISKKIDKDINDDEKNNKTAENTVEDSENIKNTNIDKNLIKIINDKSINFEILENSTVTIFESDGDYWCNNYNTILIDIYLHNLNFSNVENSNKLFVDINCIDSNGVEHIFTTHSLDSYEFTVFEYDLSKYGDIKFPLNIKSLDLRNESNTILKGILDIESFSIE